MEENNKTKNDMKLKKSERKLLEKRKEHLEEVIFACKMVDGFDYDGESMTEFGAKFLNPSARYLSKVVDSLIYTRMDFVNKDGSEIGGAIPVELVTGPDVELGTPIVTEGNMAVG